MVEASERSWLKHKIKEKKQIFVMKTENLAESGLNSEKQNAIELLCKNKGKTYIASFQSNHSPALNPRKRFPFI